MIIQGTGGLSRGIWLKQSCLLRSSICEAQLSLGCTPFHPTLADWVIQTLYLEVATYTHHHDLSTWDFQNIIHRWTLWTPSPELAHQAISTFLDIWVESPWTTGGIFIIPRVLQRNWNFMSRHIIEAGVFHPIDLPPSCRYSSLIPFCVLVCKPHQRVLPPPDRLEQFTPSNQITAWHQAQALCVRRLQ